MDPEAMALLPEFDWPDNYTQFNRILNELAIIITTQYNKTEHVGVLEQCKGIQSVAAKHLGISTPHYGGC